MLYGKRESLSFKGHTFRQGLLEGGGESKSEEPSPESVLTLPLSWSAVGPSCCKPLWQQTDGPEETLVLRVESDASCVLGVEEEGMSRAGPEELVLLPAGASGP